MRKEILIAIALGLIVGLVVTYGIYTANQSLMKKDKTNIVNTATALPISNEQEELTLTISSPTDGIVVSEPDIKVEGTTLPNAVVSILTDNDQILTEADENGVFQQDITLIKGANTIEVTATDLTNTSQTKNIQLVYSTEVNAVSAE